jgi:hypothetical protein
MKRAYLRLRLKKSVETNAQPEAKPPAMRKTVIILTALCSFVKLGKLEVVLILSIIIMEILLKLMVSCILQSTGATIQQLFTIPYLSVLKQQ